MRAKKIKHKTERIEIRCSLEMKMIVEYEAKKRGITTSELIKLALSKFMLSSGLGYTYLETADQEYIKKNFSDKKY